MRLYEKICVIKSESLPAGRQGCSQKALTIFSGLSFMNFLLKKRLILVKFDLHIKNAARGGSRKSCGEGRR